MAKRPIRSQADDLSAPAQPPSRTRVRAAKPDSAAASADTSPTMTPAEEPRSDPQPVGTGSYSMASEPNEDEIRLRAYQMYMERGGDHGRDFEDWVRAEQELRQRRKQA